MNVSRVAAYALSAFAPLGSNLSFNRSFDHAYSSLTGFPPPSMYRDLHKSWV